jgi:hypothetical protein
MPTHLELEASLLDLEPRIWRRFLLDASLSFGHLHQAIQGAVGWWDGHGYAFRSSLRARRGFAGGPEGMGGPDAWGVPLGRVFGGARPKTSCVYEYDFGDSWLVEVKLVGERADATPLLVLLLAGERAGPPEDCGGPPGYERCVAFATTGVDPWGEPEHLADWLGGWQPEVWDMAKAQARFPG